MGPLPASRSRVRFLVPLSFAVLVAALSVSTPVFAEGTSAADKATARDVATQGIQKYREGQYAEALDLLKRAQALYDAPVHLQYIARSERELGHWVEAAEVFRALAKRTLAPDAPEQWVLAVKDAQTELDALEPKIPRLLIVVRPAEAKVTRLSIDGQEVSAAVIGIERKVNPGAHALVVEAQGFPKAETHAEAREGESTKVEVQLEVAKAVVAPPPKGAAAVTAEKKEKAKKRYDVLLGLRLGLVAPGGSVPTRFARPSREEGSVQMDQVAGNGGALEFRAGITGPLGTGFLERFTTLVFLSGGSLGGQNVRLPADAALLPLRADGIELQGSPSFLSGGVSIGVGNRRDRFGGFVELGLLAYSLILDYETADPVAMCNAVAKARRTGSGYGGRLSAGLGFPIARWGTLTPYLTLGVESMTGLGFDPDDCFASWYESNDVAMPPATEDVADPVTHSMFGIGLGGEVFLGL